MLRLRVLLTGTHLLQAATSQLAKLGYLHDESDVMKSSYFLIIATAQHVLCPHFDPIHRGCAGEVVYTVVGATLQRAVFAIDMDGLFEALVHDATFDHNGRTRWLVELDNTLLVDSSDAQPDAVLQAVGSFKAFVRKYAQSLPSHVRITPFVVGVGAVIKATELHIVCARTARPLALCATHVLSRVSPAGWRRWLPSTTTAT